jgi:hypothetical protein
VTIQSSWPTLAAIAGLIFTSRRAHEILVVVFAISYIVAEANQLGIGS